MNHAAIEQLCTAYHLSADLLRQVDPKVVVPEPYVPFIPDKWNRVLVLAEAQNLSATHKKYRDKLLAMTPPTRIHRLTARTDHQLGIKPWDNGLLKMAVEVMLDCRAEETAVGNGVFWSLVDHKDRNVNPTPEMVEHAARLWGLLLAQLRPECVITAGAVARKVIAKLPKSVSPMQVLSVQLPSPRGLATLSGLFDGADLLRHYPEVAEVQARQPGWFKVKNKVSNSRLVYACHTASRARLQNQKSRPTAQGVKAR
jgi:uracil-DNA glycosylase